MKPTALTIAGSDPSGGAGIQADLKVFDRLGVYGMAVPAALTAQSTRAVTATRAVPAVFLREQLDTLLGDVRPGAVKTGMLMDAPNVRAVADALKKLKGVPLIVDPVMLSTSGKLLLTRPGVRALVESLLPVCTLVTPNIDEASVLCGFGIETVSDMEQAAKRILGMGARSVLVKGGHMESDPADVFFDGRELVRLRGKRIPGGPFHGTGCVLSAGIAAYMARGEDVLPAARKARRFLTGLMKSAARLGHGDAQLV